MITYTVEKLYHFRCKECTKWWTIADYDGSYLEPINCPRCGYIAIPQESMYDSKPQIEKEL